MNGAVARKKNIIFEDAMAGEECSIGQDAAVADVAVVGDMTVGHEEIAVADASGHGLNCAAMYGDMLPEGIAVADFQGGRLAVVLEMLGLLTKNHTGEYLVV